MTLKFVPPKEDAKAFPRYASYGAGELKTHHTLSGARNSINNRCAPRSRRQDGKWKQAFILENVEGEWFTLYHVPEEAKNNELPWMYKRWVHKQYRWKYVVEPQYKVEDYDIEYYARPMTTDEYVAWRLQVQLEILGVK